MNAPVSPADSLRAALAGLLDGMPPKQAAQAVERLIVNYRGRTPTDAPVLRDRSDVAAYAAYRMPATFEAVRAALDAFADAVPDWTPAGHTDVGGGTGAGGRPPGGPTGRFPRAGVAGVSLLKIWFSAQTIRKNAGTISLARISNLLFI